MLAAENACTEGSLQVDSESVYELERRGNFAVESTVEVDTDRTHHAAGGEMKVRVPACQSHAYDEMNKL